MAMLTSDEEDDFWTFHRKYSPQLFGKAFRVCSGHEADAHDVLQEAFLKAIVHWSSTLSGLSEQQRIGWLARTVINECRQLWRSRKDHLLCSLDEAVADSLGDDQPDAAERASQSVRLRTVCLAITNLPPRQREVMELYGIAGYGISEVAEMLDIAPATVRVHLHDGRERLPELVARVEDGDCDEG